MKNHVIALSVAASVMAATFALTSVRGSGQAQTSAPAYQVPRTSFGQPDLQGIWQAVNTAVAKSHKGHSVNSGGL